jgi:hypothetical protein
MSDPTPVVGSMEMAKVYLATTERYQDATHQIISARLPPHDGRVCVDLGGEGIARGSKNTAQGRGR